MRRRKAIALTATIIGGSIIGSKFFLSGCTNSEKPAIQFSDDDIRLLDEIGETILPHSDRSPGAKATQIGEFMKTIVTDVYDEYETYIFLSGIRTIRNSSEEKYSKNFMMISPKKRHELLIDFDKAARQKTDKGNTHFFTMMKQLTIWGYFSSEQGATKALRYLQTPGRYDACIEYKSGDRAWAFS
jgi:hypothetical protein